jgi:ribosomal protein S4E
MIFRPNLPAIVLETDSNVALWIIVTELLKISDARKEKFNILMSFDISIDQSQIVRSYDSPYPLYEIQSKEVATKKSFGKIISSEGEMLKLKTS